MAYDEVSTSRTPLETRQKGGFRERANHPRPAVRILAICKALHCYRQEPLQENHNHSLASFVSLIAFTVYNSH